MSEINREVLIPEQTTGYADELATANSMVAKINQSKRIVIAGFFISLIGIASYCYVTLSALKDQSMVLVSLALVGAGFVLWLAGAIRYFNLSIDLGDSDAIF
jgi:hypothetical protein